VVQVIPITLGTTVGEVRSISPEEKKRQAIDTCRLSVTEARQVLPADQWNVWSESNDVQEVRDTNQSTQVCLR